MDAGLLAAALITASMLQRITGTGFGLVAAPFIVLISGPETGVVLANICTALSTAIMLARVYRSVEWKKLLILIPAAIAGIVPGPLVIQHVPAAWLEVSTGVAVIAALASSQRQSSSWTTGVKPLAAAGLVSGFMNATAGVSGPAMSVYALRTRWQQLEFAATMQPYFLTLGLASTAAELAVRPSSLPRLAAWVWIVAGLAIIAGLIVGDRLARRIDVRTARRLMLSLAYIGSTAAIVRGAVTLLH